MRAQRRDLDIFASPIDISGGNEIRRTILPTVSLDKGFTDAGGRCIAVLRQLYLLGGGGGRPEQNPRQVVACMCLRS